METDCITSGGKLLLAETVQPKLLFNSLCFGLLPGWWLSSEPFRVDGPLMTETQWDKLLRENGFSGVDLVLKDTNDGELHEISVMISSADSTNAPVNGTSGKPNAYLIFDSPEQMKEQSALSIRDHLIMEGFNCTSIDYHSLPSAEIELNGSLCISLIGLAQTNLSEITHSEFLGIKNLLLGSSRLLWVVGDESTRPELAMATGLIRSVRWERDFDSPNLVILSVEDPPPEPITIADKIIACIHAHGKEVNQEFLLRRNELWVPRVCPLAKTTRHLNKKAGQFQASPQRLGQNRSVRLMTPSPGLLNKLAFEAEPIWHESLAETDVEVKIHAAGLNFMDVMIAMGQLAELSMGLEASGEVTRVGSNVKEFAVGDRVVAFATQKDRGCFQTLFRASESALVKIPPKLSMDEAAATLLVFMTVMYSLHHVARLSEGETLLIHAAAGGVGQAAIQVAQLAGAVIFATVSSAEKKAWIIKEYGLSEDRVFSSRELSFAKGIQRMTHGRGVDIVLNCLSGEALHRSWECIAPFGRFIELGRKDIVTNGKLAMRPFQKNVTYSAVDVKAIMELKPQFAAALVKQALDLVKQGKLQVPRPLRTYLFSEVETAFRMLQTGQAMGKTIIKPHVDDVVQVSLHQTIA
jgi:NADPH:quinone reductase-like Zn-dependent oxidoreductase